jgi:hypothetical protein
VRTDLRTESVAVRADGDAVHVTGDILNSGRTAVSFPKAECVLYDALGRVVGAESAFGSARDLAPQGRTAFTCSFHVLGDIAKAAVAGYRVTPHATDFGTRGTGAPTATTHAVTVGGASVLPSGTGVSSTIVGGSGGGTGGASGCGSRGGPGYRLSNGKCASWDDARGGRR